jgi:hypothetical protein
VWEVTEPPWDKPILDATYLNDVAICRVTSQDRANVKAVDLIAYAKQSDLVFTPQTSGIFRSTNQKKLLAVLLSKAIANTETFDGTVTFSRSEIEIED